MPKTIDNYRLQPIQTQSVDRLEYFSGKQNGTNKKFILKRFKPDLPPVMLSSKYKAESTQTEVLFQKLTNQTMILKNLSHNGLPKCTRMLKTSNSIYFVWENYPLTSLQQFLENSWMKLQQKIQISTQMLQILEYLHEKKVAHKNLTPKNIKIDSQRNIYFTDFKEAVRFNKENETLEQVKMLKVLILEDIYQMAKILFDVFQFKKINPSFNIIPNSVQRKLYQHLSQIINKKIHPSSLETFKRIMNEKVNIRSTQCTDTSESIPSPTAVKSLFRRVPILTDSNFQKKSQTGKSSVSCSKITLKSALQRAELLRSEKTMLRKSKNELQSTVFNNVSSSRSQIKPLTPKARRQHQSSTKELFQISANRKLVNLFLHCINFIEKAQNLKLIYLISLKCEEYTTQIKNQVENCSSKHLETNQMEFLKIINKENLKTQTFLAKIKDNIFGVIKETSLSEAKTYQGFQDAYKRGKTLLIEEALSSEIYNYLFQQISLSQYNSKPINPPLNQQLNKMQTSIKLLQATSSPKVKRKSSILQAQDTELDYDSYKFYYYLSIKLKYGTFENFLDKKNLQNDKFDILKDEYFAPFQFKAIPVSQLAEEIVQRMERFAKVTESLKNA